MANNDDYKSKPSENWLDETIKRRPVVSALAAFGMFAGLFVCVGYVGKLATEDCLARGDVPEHVCKRSPFSPMPIPM